MKRKVIAYLHTHWDREWYKTFEEFNIRLSDIVDEIIKELECSRAPSFYFDGQTDAIRTYLKFRPENKNKIKKLIKEKKLFIGPFSVSADSFMSSGYFLARNFENGLNFARDLGCSDFIGYLPDTFGHGKSIFEILKYLKIENSIVWRGTPDIESDFIFNGVKTTRLVRGYFFDFFHNGADTKTIEENIDKVAEYTNSKDILLPIGADHLAILTNSVQKIEDFNKKSEKYEIILSNPFEYIKNADYKKKYQGEFLDNSSTYILQGVYSGRIPQKVQNSKCEWILSRITEPFDIIKGSKYKTCIDYAQKLLIKNHAHDSIYGCSKDEVNHYVSLRYEQVEQISNYLNKKLIKSEFDKLNKEEGKNYICAYNFSNFERAIPVTFKTHKKIKGLEVLNKEKGFPDYIFYDKTKIPVTEDYTDIYEYIVKAPLFKPFSKNIFELKPLKGDVKIGDDFIENQKIKLSVKNGVLNIEDKKNNKIIKDFLNIVDTKDMGDSYNCAPKSKPLKKEIIKTKVLKKGSLYSVLCVYFKDLILEISLFDNADFLKFKAKINNKEKNHKIQARFNLEENIFKTTAEDGFGVIKREHDPNYSLLENLPVQRPKEAKTNIYPIQRFVMAQGSLISTIGLREYEIYKNTLSIPLLRCFSSISNPNNIARSIPAGPPIQTPEAQLLGKYEVEFSYSFISDTEDMYKITEEFYGAALAFCFTGNSKETSKTFITLPKNNLLYGMKDKNTAICYDFKENKIKDIEV